MSRWETFTTFGISQRRLIVGVNDLRMNSKKGKKELCVQTAAGVSDAASLFRRNLVGEGSAVIAS